MMNEDENLRFEPVHTSSPPIISSPNSSFTAGAPTATNPIRGRSRRAIWSPPPSQTSSMPSFPHSAIPASNLTSTTCSGAVNLFHRATSRVVRELDDNEQAQRRLQREQDGSEVKSVELERLTAEGQTLIERRNSMELFRDLSAEAFEHHTGTPWRPRTGSMVNHRHLTSAMIDSRDFLAAKRRAETEVMLPTGPKVAVTGGADFNDHRLIWAKLDQVHTKHPDMVLLHGGTPKGAELIASRWADHRKVQQVSFKPDWTKHGKAAPFKRNDAMLDVLPVGVLVFPGTGIQENLADKARKLGIPVMKFDGGA